MKKLFKYSGLTLLVLLILLSIVVLTGEVLPEGSEQKIQSLSEQPLPELFPGETQYANNNGVKIWYEIQRPKVPVKGTIVLSMGGGGTATFWPEYVLQPLLAKGYQVIRYDYRGTGMSDWMQDWTEDTAYSLDDMANDILTILDQQKINRAHILGMSFGGAVARRFADLYPQRSESLTLVVSTGKFVKGGEPRLSELPFLTLPRLLVRHGLWDNETERVKFILGIMHLMNHGASYPIDDELVIQQILYEQRKRKGFHVEALKQHAKAVAKTLEKIKQQNAPPPGDVSEQVPILYIMGEKDPIMTVEAAEQLVAQEKNSQLTVLNGIAHVVTEDKISEAAAALSRHMSSGSHNEAKP